MHPTTTSHNAPPTLSQGLIGCADADGCATSVLPRQPAAGGRSSGTACGVGWGSAAAGVGTGTDGGDVGHATGATRTFFCCTDDLQLEPDPGPLSCVGVGALGHGRTGRPGQHPGGYASSSDDGGSTSASTSEDEAGKTRGSARVRGAAAARPGAARMLVGRSVPLARLASGDAGAARGGGDGGCWLQHGDALGEGGGLGGPAAQQHSSMLCMNGGSPRQDSSPAHAPPCAPAANSCHIPSTPSSARVTPLQPSPYAYITPNKAFPVPGHWDSCLPARTDSTLASSATSTPGGISSRAPTPAGLPSTEGKEQGRGAAHADKLQAAARTCVPRCAGAGGYIGQALHPHRAMPEVRMVVVQGGSKLRVGAGVRPPLCGPLGKS